jgi:hypothetical protein
MKQPSTSVRVMWSGSRPPISVPSRRSPGGGGPTFRKLRTASVRRITRTKLFAVGHRVLSNTLLTTFFASKYSSAN